MTRKSGDWVARAGFYTSNSAGSTQKAFEFSSEISMLLKWYFITSSQLRGGIEYVDVA
jgi:hypothetical protein